MFSDTGDPIAWAIAGGSRILVFPIRGSPILDHVVVMMVGGS